MKILITDTAYRHLKDYMGKYNIQPIAGGGIGRDKYGNFVDAQCIEVAEIIEADTEKIKVNLRYYRKASDYYADMKKYDGFNAYIYRDSIFR